MANLRGPGAVYKYWAWYGGSGFGWPPRRTGRGAGCWVIAGTWPSPGGSCSSQFLRAGGFLEMISGLSLYSALGFGSIMDTCTASVSEASGSFLRVVQTVQKTVKVPHLFLDMAVDRCRMVQTVQKLWSPQLVLPLLCLCLWPSQQRQWFLRCHGLRAFLATVTLLRRASLCHVSWGVWRKVSSPEVLRLLFCERRMRCGFVWCSSYSSQWMDQGPGSCFLDKDVDVPLLATSWSC